jgi:hypothetical protein
MEEAFSSRFTRGAVQFTVVQNLEQAISGNEVQHLL